MTCCFAFEIQEQYPSWHLLVVTQQWKQQNTEICSKLTIKTPERCHSLRFDILTANFEQISYDFLVFPLLTLNK